MALSPDGKTLYVTGAGSLALTAYPLEGAGLPGKGRVLCQLAAGGEGLAVDRAGNVYVTLPGRNAVQVVNPEGARLALLPLPGAPVACALGGVGGKVLHVTTRTALCMMTVESGAGVAAK